MGGPILLVIDQNPGTRTTLVMILQKHGYRALSAATQPEALILLENRKIEAILIDPAGPEQGGIPLLGAIRTTYPHIPVIVIASALSIEDYVAILATGVSDCYQKPLDPAQILYLVQRNLLRPGPGFSEVTLSKWADQPKPESWPLHPA